MDIGKLDHMPTVKSVMTPFPHSIGVDERLVAARARMSELGIRHLPVMDGDDLIGVVTERDARLALADLFTQTAPDLLVRDVVARDTYVVELHTPLDVVVAEMARRHIGSALVVKAGKLAGIFTATDACKRFSELLRARYPGGDDDAA